MRCTVINRFIAVVFSCTNTHHLMFRGRKSGMFYQMENGLLDTTFCLFEPFSVFSKSRITEQSTTIGISQTVLCIYITTGIRTKRNSGFQEVALSHGSIHPLKVEVTQFRSYTTYRDSKHTKFSVLLFSSYFYLLTFLSSLNSSKTLMQDHFQLSYTSSYPQA